MTTQDPFEVRTTDGVLVSTHPSIADALASATERNNRAEALQIATRYAATPRAAETAQP